MADIKDKIIGGFKVLVEIQAGSGSQGTVYKAECVDDRHGLTPIGTIVALKVMAVQDDDQKKWRSLSKRTSELAKLNHPNVVKYYGCFSEPGPFNDIHVVVQEFLDGETLKERLAKCLAGIDVDEALHIVDEAMAGLEYTSELGLVHRDVKPGNIFLCKDGGVKLIDFEIAKQDNGTTTASGSNIRGSFDYMAPDFIDADFHGDVQSDVFSMGVVLHEILTGRTPYQRFEGDGKQANFIFLSRWSSGGNPIRISSRVRRLLAHADEALNGALAIKRDERFADFKAFRAAMKGIRFRDLKNGPRTYRMLQFIGKGGFGEVFKARCRQTGETVAIKHLLKASYAERFRREAKIMQKLQDPCFVRLVDFFEQDIGGSLEAFLVMAFLDGMPGSSLRDAIRHPAEVNGLNWSDVFLAFERYACALKAMHALGIFHRDIKPSNLYYPQGHPERSAIMDLGIARDINGTATHGQVPGTLDYMPPEVVISESRGDSGMDIYALGLCFYEALTLHPAYPRLPSGTASYAQFFERAKSHQQPLFNDARVVQSESLLKLLRGMTNPDEGKRMKDAGEVAARIRELRNAQADEQNDDPESQTIGTVAFDNPSTMLFQPDEVLRQMEVERRRIRKRRTIRYLIAFLVIAAIGGGGWFLLRSRIMGGMFAPAVVDIESVQPAQTDTPAVDADDGAEGKREAEAAARRRAEEEEAEARRIAAAEDARRKAEAADLKKKEDEDRSRAEMEADQARRKVAEEVASKRREAEFNAAKNRNRDSEDDAVISDLLGASPEDIERQKEEEAAEMERQRIAAEKKAEADKKAREEAERIAREQERLRLEAQRKAEEVARMQAEKEAEESRIKEEKAAEEARRRAKSEAERKAAELAQKKANALRQLKDDCRWLLLEEPIDSRMSRLDDAEKKIGQATLVDGLVSEADAAPLEAEVKARRTWVVGEVINACRFPITVGGREIAVGQRSLLVFENGLPKDWSATAKGYEKRPMPRDFEGKTIMLKESDWTPSVVRITIPALGAGVTCFFNDEQVSGSLSLKPSFMPYYCTFKRAGFRDITKQFEVEVGKEMSLPVPAEGEWRAALVRVSLPTLSAGVRCVVDGRLVTEYIDLLPNTYSCRYELDDHQPQAYSFEVPLGATSASLPLPSAWAKNAALKALDKAAESLAAGNWQDAKKLLSAANVTAEVNRQARKRLEEQVSSLEEDAQRRAAEEAKAARLKAEEEQRIADEKRIAEGKRLAAERAERERKAREEAERLKREVEERRIREEAERQKKEEEARKRREEEERKMAEEAKKLALENAVSDARFAYENEDYGETVRKFHEAKEMGHQLTDQDVKKLDAAYSKELKKLNRQIKVVNNSLAIGKSPLWKIEDLEAEKRRLNDQYRSIKNQ